MFKNINIVYCWYFKMNTLNWNTLSFLDYSLYVYIETWASNMTNGTFICYFSIIIIGLHCIICFAPHYKSDTYMRFMQVVCYIIKNHMIYITNYQNAILPFSHINISSCTKWHIFRHDFFPLSLSFMFSLYVTLEHKTSHK